MPIEFNSETIILLSGGLVVGLLVGVLIADLVWRRRQGRLEQKNVLLTVQLKSQDELERERATALEHAGERLASSLLQVTNKTFQSHSQTLLKLAEQNLGKHHERAKGELAEKEQAIESLIRPIRDSLKQTAEQMTRIEKERQESFGGIRAQLEAINADQQTLRSETANLVTALRRPEVRGQWGEITLRRAVELAGMVEHCDFFEQEHRVTEDGVIRPDMIIRLPERRELVVDVKTPLDAYLSAV